MAFSRSLFLIGTAALLTLSACSSPNKSVMKDSNYWQRASVSQSVYQRGPKAQQMLNRDISRCVTELRELERLGAVKNAIPPRLKRMNIDETQLTDWDTPERDKHLYAEHSDYHDFEGCMQAKGWERVMHVPYDVAEDSYRTYRKAHIDYAYESRAGARHEKMSAETPGYSGDFGNVNE